MDKSKFNYDLKEPLAKKQLVESSNNKNGPPSTNSSSSPSSLASFNPVASGTLTTANSNKMKIKILQNKDAPSDLLGSDKSIGISIEINGALYQGTLYSQNSSVSLNDSKKIDSSALKIDLVY